MRRVEPDPDESRRKLSRAANRLATHARCSPPGLSRIASLIGKIQACRPVDHSSGANGCFSSCGGNAHPDQEWQLATLLSHSDRGQRGTALQLWLNRLSSSMSLARQLDPNEGPFSMLTHSSGTCHKRSSAYTPRGPDPRRSVQSTATAGYARSRLCCRRPRRRDPPARRKMRAPSALSLFAAAPKLLIGR